jgi:hypothetical protein
MQGREILTLVVVAVLVGCGADEPADWSGRSAAQAAPEAGAEELGNRPPVIRRVALDPAQPAPGDRVRAVVDASDPDGDAIQLVYAWRFGGKTLRSDGPSVEMPTGMRGARLEVRVTASDGEAESAAMHAGAHKANGRPRLTEVMLEPHGEVQRGDSVFVSARAGDPDGDPVELEVRWAVNGRWQSAGEREFSTEGLKRGDRIRARVTASDGERKSEPIESAEVMVANAAPRIVSSPPGQLADGEFQYQLEAEDPDGDRTLRFRLLEGPTGMAVDPIRGVVRWKPGADQVGAHPVDLAVEDPMGATTAQRFEITVRETGTETVPASQAD